MKFNYVSNLVVGSLIHKSDDILGKVRAQLSWIDYVIDGPQHGMQSRS